MKSFSYRAYLLNIIFSGCCFWIIRNAIVERNLFFFLFSFLEREKSFFLHPHEKVWKGGDSFEFPKNKVNYSKIFLFLTALFKRFAKIWIFLKLKNIFSRLTVVQCCFTLDVMKGYKREFFIHAKFLPNAGLAKIRMRIGLGYRLSVRFERSNFSDRPLFFSFLFPGFFLLVISWSNGVSILYIVMYLAPIRVWELDFPILIGLDVGADPILCTLLWWVGGDGEIRAKNRYVPSSIICSWPRLEAANVEISYFEKDTVNINSSLSKLWLKFGRRNKSYKSSTEACVFTIQLFHEKHWKWTYNIFIRCFYSTHITLIPFLWLQLCHNATYHSLLSYQSNGMLMMMK